MFQDFDDDSGAGGWGDEPYARLDSVAAVVAAAFAMLIVHGSLTCDAVVNPEDQICKSD
jgi:hypothetical protein